MTKVTAIFITVLGFLFVTALSTPVLADEICACYQKKHGQLRVVGSHSECLPSELPITLGASTGIGNIKLQCVTGTLSYIVSGSPDYCADEYSLRITNPYPSDINPDDIFEVYCEAPNPYVEDDVLWGLRCKDGWVNTGCSQVSGEHIPDILQFLNGCYSDNEEYGEVDLFTTCCKIIVTTE